MELRRWDDERGALHLPLAAIFVLMGVTVIGISTLLQQWTALTRTQLRLDRCIGKQALGLKSRLHSLEAANTRIRALRIALASASLSPPARATLQAALQAQVLVQDALLREWEVRQVAWRLSSGCGRPGDDADPLPDLKYEREPPDTTGPQVLTWVGEENPELWLQVRSPPRRSTALIQGEDHGNSKLWKAQWASAR